MRHTSFVRVRVYLTAERGRHGFALQFARAAYAFVILGYSARMRRLSSPMVTRVPRPGSEAMAMVWPS